MHRSILIASVLAAGVLSQGCQFSPWEGENISDPTDLDVTGYTSAAGTWVSTVVGSPDNCTKTNLGGCGVGVRADLTSIADDETLSGLTGYEFQNLGIDLTGANWRFLSACLDPGVDESAHAYVGTYTTPCMVGAGPPNSGDLDDCATPLTHFMSEEPVGCWGDNGSNWIGFNNNCRQDDPVEIFFDQPPCATEPPAGYGCDELNGVKVCFPDVWPNGAATIGNVAVLVNFDDSDPSAVNECISEGPSDTCVPTTDPRIGFYQDGDPLCTFQGQTCEDTLWSCVEHSGGFDFVCTALVDRDEFGLFAAYAPDDTGGYFTSPNY